MEVEKEAVPTHTLHADNPRHRELVFAHQGCFPAEVVRAFEFYEERQRTTLQESELAGV